MDQTEMKIAAARAALAEVRDGMRLGLGTGSTAAEFVRLLAAAGLRDLRCTCTSDKTETLANSLGITTFPLAAVAPLDLAVDGADALDDELRLIKGGGGALLREKIVEQAAKRFLVIADETKVVQTFAGQKLPVEVTPFAREVLEQRFADLHPVLRLRDGAPRVRHTNVAVSLAGCSVLSVCERGNAAAARAPAGGSAGPQAPRRVPRGG